MNCEPATDDDVNLFANLCDMASDGYQVVRPLIARVRSDAEKIRYYMDLADTLQKQNEPPSCGPSPAPVGASVEDILARINALERVLRELEWRFKDFEDCANNGPSICDGHATLKTIVAAHWDHIVALQKRVTDIDDHLVASVKAQDGSIAWIQKQVRELTEKVNASEPSVHDASVWKQKAITNLLKAGCDDPEECAGECLSTRPRAKPAEPSVPVSELRVAIINHGGLECFLSRTVEKLIAKAEGGAK